MKKRKILFAEESTCCQLCNDQSEETTYHVFFKCSFVSEVWVKIQAWLDFNLEDADNLEGVLMNFTNAIYGIVQVTETWFNDWSSNRNLEGVLIGIGFPLRWSPDKDLW